MSSLIFCFFIQGNVEGNCVHEKKGGPSRITAQELEVKGVTARKDISNQRPLEQKHIKLENLLPLLKGNFM